MDNGNQFKMLAHNVSESNIYIQKIVLNGKPYKKNYITHNDIVSGGTIEFFMEKKAKQKNGGI